MHLQNYLQIYFPSLRKFIIAFLLFTIVIPGSFIYLPQKAEAIPVIVIEDVFGVPEWVVQTIKQIGILIEDTITAVKTTYLALKEAVLDPIAKALGNQLTDQLTRQMFSFIASGNVIDFKPGETAKGNEAFVTNPQQFFGSVAEESTQVFLTDLQNNRPDRMASINNAVRQRILEENYVDPKRMERSTFPGGDAAFQAYIKNPSTCPTGNPWDCYLAARRPENDPQQILDFERSRSVAKRNTDVKLSEEEVLAGSGFHTLKDCVEKDVNTNCTQYLNKTPGDSLAGQINLYLNNALKNLQNADEVDEVLTAGMSSVQSWMNGKGLANL